MCGIFASIGLPPCRDAIETVAHRGPDGHGWEEHPSAVGTVALGHRRLAIIDVSDKGLQPITDATGRYRLLLNGEIYNYRELRRELQERGKTFTTDTDSEVLLQAFMLWDEGALPRLIGMFALVIWDTRDQRLFAARDRFGIKPLYVLRRPGSIAFASEIKQLLVLEGVDRRANLPRIFDFLDRGLSDHTTETMFAGICQLAPGEWMSVRAASGSLNVQRRRWYYVEQGEPLNLTEADAAEQFKALLDDSICLHLRSDVPLGACLSGGLTRSSIVCLMTKHLAALDESTRVQTISASFPQTAVDEKPYVDAVAKHTGATSWFTYPRAEDVFALVSKITWHQDEPFGSTSPSSLSGASSSGRAKPVSRLF